MTARTTALAVAAAALAGCATSFVTTNEPDATIYFDGRPLGKEGRVAALGPPRTARVLVVAKDGRRARALVQRRWSQRTFWAGVRTLGFCFVFCWDYPFQTHVPLPPPQRTVAWDDDPAASAWGSAPADRWGSAPAASAWDEPPGAIPTATATSTPTATPTATAPSPQPSPPLRGGEGEPVPTATSTPTAPSPLPSPPLRGGEGESVPTPTSTATSPSP